MPAFACLVKTGRIFDLVSAGAIIRECFCGPRFGAGDTPANGEFSIRHTTRNPRTARAPSPARARFLLLLSWTRAPSRPPRQTAAS